MSIRRFFVVICVAVTATAPIASASTAKPITAKQAGAQYLADVVPLQTATDNFTVAFDKWAGANGAPAQTTVFVKPFIAAHNAFDHLILTQRWPTNVLIAVQRRASAGAVVVADLERLPSVNVHSLSEWVSKFERDDAARAVAANVVRSDLRLPLVTT